MAVAKNDGAIHPAAGAPALSHPSHDGRLGERLVELTLEHPGGVSRWLAEPSGPRPELSTRWLRAISRERRITPALSAPSQAMWKMSTTSPPTRGCVPASRLSRASRCE